MRDPNRIIPILDAIREIWEANPDLRLGQLIVNAIRPSQPCPQIFGAEDTVLQKGLAGLFKPGQPRYSENEVTLGLTLNEALVLFEFVSRFSEHDRLSVEHPAEAQVLYNLCC